MRRAALLGSFVLPWCFAPAAAQAPAPKDAQQISPAQLEAELNGKAVQILLAFARTAESGKVRSKARAAYELILGYDPEQRAARTALGFRKEKGEWREAAAGKEPAWQDAPPTAQLQQRVVAGWGQLQKELASLHRALGLQLQARNEPALAARHLERALSFDPADVEAHRALGHREHKGFYGTAEQVAFLERLAAIEGKAKELGATDCKPEALEGSAMPPELRSTGLPFQGAKTAHVTVWATSPAEDVAELAQCGERALRMLNFLLGERAAQYDVQGELGRFTWFGLVHSAEEKDAFLDHNKAAFDIDVSLIRDYAGWSIRAEGGRAHVSWGAARIDKDVIVAHVTEYGFAQRCNEGFSEGLVHAMTSLLVGTTHTFYGTVPNTVAGRTTRPEDPDPDGWRERLRDEIDQHTDWPLQQIPRERLDQYRPRVRMKAWSVVLWLFARYPEQWATLLRAFPDPKENASLTPEQATDIIEKTLGRKLPDIEAEWREWAGGTSPLAKASGYPR